jgi:hypothetical protein
MSDPICSFLVISRCVRDRAAPTPLKSVFRVVQLRMTSAVVSRALGQAQYADRVQDVVAADFVRRGDTADSAKNAT